MALSSMLIFQGVECMARMTFDIIDMMNAALSTEVVVVGFSESYVFRIFFKVIVAPAVMFGISFPLLKSSGFLALECFSIPLLQGFGDVLVKFVDFYLALFLVSRAHEHTNRFYVCL